MSDRNNTGPLRVCVQADIKTGKSITGYEACRPGRPAKMSVDKYKLHYVVHYMHRGFWDVLVPEEDQTRLGLIEAYHCTANPGPGGCSRRFRNNHNRKSYPGRGSIICHLATEHGQLLKAMRADTVIDMTEEIDAINEHENGKFLEMGIPDIPDNELYKAVESFMWKIENEKKEEDEAKKKKEENTDGSSRKENDPKIIPLSKTEMSEKGISSGNRQNQKVFECPHCEEYKNNNDPSKLRLHLFLHYRDRWDSRLDKLEKGANSFYCDTCPKRKQLKGADEAGAKTSAICHFAIHHHELRTVLNKNERLPTHFVKDLYADVDSKEGTQSEQKAEEKSPPSPVKEPEASKSANIPEPARARRSKLSKREKGAWMSSDDENEEEDVPSSPKKKTVKSSGKRKKN